MKSAIDTNILLDILLDDPEFSRKSSEVIQRYNLQGPLLICPVVYAELGTQFVRVFEDNAKDKLDEFLKDLGIQLINFTTNDLALAAHCWNRYRKRRSLDEIECPSCGTKNKITCLKCITKIVWRNHIIPDFLIGAHASNHADYLLTRDRGFYKKYFKLKIDN